MRQFGPSRKIEFQSTPLSIERSDDLARPARTAESVSIHAPLHREERLQLV